MTPNELALALQGYAGKAAQTILELSQKVEELEAVVATFGKPCPIVPVAEVPVRVLSVEIPEDAE